MTHKMIYAVLGAALGAVSGLILGAGMLVIFKFVIQ